MTVVEMVGKGEDRVIVVVKVQGPLFFCVHHVVLILLSFLLLVVMEVVVG